MPREVNIAPCSGRERISGSNFRYDSGLHVSPSCNSSYYFTADEDLPPPKRTYGNDHRSKVLVISDSESDSDLPAPPPVSSPTRRRPAASRLSFKQPPAQGDIIDISSDSEQEDTPTRPLANRPLPEKYNQPVVALPAVPSHSVSNALSTTLERVNLVDSPSLLSSKAGISLLSRDEEPNSSDVSDNIDIFDGDSHHPGLITFDIGPRRPKLIPSGSSTSVSTTPAPTPSQSSVDDDPFNDVQTPSVARPPSKTGNAKAGSSGSGIRSRVRTHNDDNSTAPETPQPKPRPKARAAAVTALSSPVTLSPKLTPRNRAKVLEAQAIALFSELNKSIFGDRLPKDCAIVWSKKLNTTAGRAHWKRIRDSNGNVIRHESYIELSTKVVDCEERIKNTLSHEMCHLAAWIFDGETNKQHGPKFKHWASRVMDGRPDITITTCHAYEIAYKYEWKCSSEECGRTYGRHSKSIDPTKQICGCGGRLTPLFTTTPRRTAFQDYLKNHMKDFKAANPGMQHGEAMKRLGEMFRAEKEAAVDDELDQVMGGMTRLKLGASIE
ncbi:hypothetical protein FS749_000061 [Ceratobasidium sp. UAMH 11750]|nr:hypothetical protein FS749_000061 [Ceratobasidium sp. UAMH 11750]